MNIIVILIAINILLALAGCAPKNETVINDTTAQAEWPVRLGKDLANLHDKLPALTEWTLPNRVIIVPPPYCEPQFRTYVRTLSTMNPLTVLTVVKSGAKVISCYREGYEAL